MKEEQTVTAEDFDPTDFIPKTDSSKAQTSFKSMLEQFYSVSQHDAGDDSLLSQTDAKPLVFQVVKDK